MSCDSRTPLCQLTATCSVGPAARSATTGPCFNPDLKELFVSHSTMTSLRAVCAVASALLGMAANSFASAAVVARAEVTAEDQRVELVEQRLEGGALQRMFRAEGGVTLYRSVAGVLTDGLEVQVLVGHPSQRGSFRLQAGRLDVRDGEGKPLWSETLTEPLCLPELSGEFIRAHWDRLAPGAKPLRCVTPIIKAKKVAPLQWRRLADLPGGERVVEVGPGSFGMRFFVIPTRLTFSADGTRLLSQQGQFEAPLRTEGRARYLRGFGQFTQTRWLENWRASLFGPPAGAP